MIRKEMIDGVEVELNYCQYFIATTEFTSEFFGANLKHKETNNWHYYKMFTGEILHFRKEHMVFVKENNVTEEEFNIAEKEAHKMQMIKRKQ